MKQTLRIILASALITAAAIKGAPALAEPAPVAISVVTTADLDLTTTSGQRQLQVRLAHAAREVCGTASDVDLKGKNDVRECRNVVLAEANAQREHILAAGAQAIRISLASAR